MDLSMCKLVCLSRVKIKDKSVGRLGVYDDKDVAGKLNASRSVQKLSPVSRSPNTIKRKNTVLELSPAPSQKSLNSIFPALETSKSSRNMFRPRSLICVKREKKEKEVKPIEWVQPVCRQGVIGAMFTNMMRSSQAKRRSIMLRKLVKENKTPESETAEELYVQYKEPYIQQILGKKLKKVS